MRSSHFHVVCAALMLVGLARIAVGERPSRVITSAKWTESGVDRVIAATVEFPSGALAQVSCHMSGAFHRSAVIVADLHRVAR